MTTDQRQSEAAQEIARLMTLHPKGFDLSLDRIRRLLDRLDNPQDHMPPVIHIAGTNGKGSCAAFSRALLEAAGLTVHVHTSPHLVNWHERFRLGADGGGRFAEDAILADAIRRVANANGGETITVFEILTAVMFLLFSEHPADAAIVEVGLGGRFDATNVIVRPAVSIIMPVALDHEAYLGDRAELIAAEKAGIIKPGCPTVIGAQEFDAAREVLVATAERALARVSWPARMQRLTQGRLVELAPKGAELWLDGGHNPSAGAVVAEALADLEEQNPRPLLLISGMINTKDQSGYFAAFKGMARHVFTVPVADSDAGVPSDELAARAQSAGLSAEPIASVENALRLLGESWDEREVPPRILIGGSLYLAGEVLRDNGTLPV